MSNVLQQAVLRLCIALCNMHNEVLIEINKLAKDQITNYNC